MKTAALALVSVFLLAGCASEPAPAMAGPLPTDGMVLHGTVQTPSLAPLQANVTITQLNLTETTGPDGSFRFPEMPIDAYSLRVESTGYATRTVTVPPGSNESLLISLEALQATPTQDTERYKGHLNCAAEYLIISGSCDRVSTELEGPAFIDAQGAFQHHIPSDWASVVVDVVFDPAAASTYDGLRVTAKGVNDADALTDYEQFGRFHGSTSFTFRIEPGETYPDGAAPVPGNTTTLVFDVFAQGHGYRAVCEPTGTYACFMGVGAGIDIQFELIVTTFTIDRAPNGFTLN